MFASEDHPTPPAFAIARRSTLPLKGRVTELAAASKILASVVGA
jgi:hypothetical protein